MAETPTVPMDAVAATRLANPISSAPPTSSPAHDAKAAVASSACPALRQQANRLLPANLRKSNETHIHSGGCVPIKDNLLGLAARTLKPGASSNGGEEDSELFKARLGLAWLGPKGEGPPRFLKMPAELQGALEEVEGAPGEGITKWARLGGATDFDGDGAPELLIVLATGGHEELTKLQTQLWTLRGDVLSRYRHDPKLPVFETPDSDEPDGIEQQVLRDVDGDGRPELIHIGPYLGKEVPCLGLFDALPVPALFAYHADVQGKFSASDGVAQQHIRRYCGVGPAQMAPHAAGQDGPNDLTERLTRYVVCARIQGQPAHDLLKCFELSCPTWNATGFLSDTATAEELQEAKKKPSATTCPQWLVELVNVNPPLTMSPTQGKAP